eukprot:9473700-Pyramimonas_sp.AAC.1
MLSSVRCYTTKIRAFRRSGGECMAVCPSPAPAPPPPPPPPPHPPSSEPGLAILLQSHLACLLIAPSPQHLSTPMHCPACVLGPPPEALSQQMRALQSKCSKREDRIAVLSGRVKELSDELNGVMEMVQYRSGDPGSHVSKIGGYALAIARNKGHCGAEVTLDMVASDSLHGGVQDKKIIYKYQHKVAAAKRLRAREAYSAIGTMVGPVGPVGDAPAIMRIPIME